MVICVYRGTDSDSVLMLFYDYLLKSCIFNGILRLIKRTKLKMLKINIVIPEGLIDRLRNILNCIYYYREINIIISN
jgi:hypothetical protein